MSAVQDLLVEIGTEELPPKALLVLSQSFVAGLEAELARLGLPHGTLEPFATPRRLAVLVRAVPARQPDRELVRRGPSRSAAFDAQGRPTKAAEGFARSCGVPVEDLGIESSDKGEWLVHRSREAGAATAALIPSAVEAALAGLPIPKRMRWGAGETEFVRPIHWVCLLFGREAIPGRVLNVEAAPWTRGHRFHHPGILNLAAASDYPEVLRQQGWVEPDFARRRDEIRSQVRTLAQSLDLRARIDEHLLDEVTALVEWPVALAGRFDAAFLDIPAEVLIETMQIHQRYFPLEDAAGRLQAAFIAIANLRSRDPAQVQAGNERVIRPRFADAAFFWQQDLREAQETRRDRLEQVVFQQRLGSLGDKTRRLRHLMATLSGPLAADPALLTRAAELAKTDLVSSMVFEFPSLQGTMGRYYAERAGEDPCVYMAMAEQYLPRVAGDRLPRTPCGQALAIADRIDSLVGIFGIGLRPTGAKDPYGLRRASIAVLRLSIEGALDLDLRSLLEAAAAAYPAGVLSEDTVAAVLAYTLDRLRAYYEDQGVTADAVESVLRLGITHPLDADRRIRAVTAFRALEAAVSLASADKRTRNILAQWAATGAPTPPEVDRAYLVEAAERHLAARIADLEGPLNALLREGDYPRVLTRLAELAPAVDAFFDGVMVMAEEPEQRRNRIALLARLHALFGQVADLSCLQWTSPHGV